MVKLIVKLPFHGRSMRSKVPKLTEIDTDNERTGKSSKDRVQKYREKLRNDPNQKEKLEKMKVIKKEENKAYRLKIKMQREQNKKFDEEIKAKNRLRMQNLRKKGKEQSRKQKAKQTEIKSKTTKSEKTTFKLSKTLRNTESTRKKAQRIRQALPQDPKKWADTVNTIVNKASPRRKTLLHFQSSIVEDIDNVVGVNKPGRPLKSKAHTKKKLAFTERARNVWRSKKALKQYQSRKKAQHKYVSKRNIHLTEWKPKVEKFLDNNSRIMPNKKDTVKIDGKVTAKRHLLMSKAKLYDMFKKENQEFDRKFVTFLKMIPKNYKTLNLTCRRVCVCSKDYNLDQKIEALNKFSEKSHQELKTTSRILSDVTLCPYETLPNRSCIDRTCVHCGTSAIQELYKPLIENCTGEILKYHQWETRPESYINKEGKCMKTNRWIQAEHKSKVTDLIDEVVKDMESFSAHLFRTNYQHKMENNAITNLPINQCVVVMDFSENITLQPQDEIESSHWTIKQVTLHPVFIVRHAENSTDEEPVIVKESLIILSDNLSHNSGAVYVFTKQLLLHLKNNPGPCDIKVIHRFTDNCATQYKCKDAFSHLKLIEEVHDMKIVYHYTESGHGKGPSDGLGAAIKKRLERLILGGRVINNGYEAYLALQQTQTENVRQKIVYLPQSKLIKEMPPKDPSVKTVKGTQSFHMVKLNNQDGTLECSDLSCTCAICIRSDQEGPCFFMQYRHAPQSQKMFPGHGHTCSNGGALASGSGGGVDSCSQSNDHVLHQAIEHSLNDQSEHADSNRNQLHLFADCVAKKGWQLRGKTPADGNCAFWAISDQLEWTGSQLYTHTQLRKKVVQHIKDLPEHDKQAMSRFMTQSVDSYIRAMEQNGTYADHICLQTMSKMLSMEILVVHADEDIKLSPIGTPTGTLVLGYIPDLKHYVSLEPLKRFEKDDFVAVNLTGDRSQHIYVAKVVEVDQDDVKLRFLKETRTAGIFVWPNIDDVAWQPHTDVLQKLCHPELLPGRGIRMKFNMNDSE